MFATELSLEVRFNSSSGDREVYDTPSAMSLGYMCVSEARIVSA